MTAQTLQDEDLIILSDDTSSHDIFNFDTSVAPSAVTSDIIDFGTEEISFETPTFWEVSPMQETPTSEVVVENNDFSFGLSFETPVIQEQIAEVSEAVATPVLEEVFSFDTQVQEALTSTEEVESSIEEVTMENPEVSFMQEEAPKQEVGNVEAFDVNTILDATIAQLQARKEVNFSNKSQKSSQVTDLLSQITKLQAQVESLNSDILEIDAENKKIDKNIVSIEKMKADAVEVSEVPERQRKHAAEKIKNVK